MDPVNASLRRALVVATILLAWAASAALAQSAPESALKAAFLYNFAKFAEWPADAPSADPLTVCVFGDSAIADALDQTVKGRTVDGRKTVVVRVKPEGFRGCHVLYLAGLDTKHTQAVIDDLKGAPVLTVGDREQFAQSGGVAGLFVEQGRMRFAINVEAAQRGRLRISSRLLSLAKIVKDDNAHP
jgi:hypothetical protein